MSYKKDYDINDYTTLKGALEEDITSLKQINENIKREGSKATKEATQETVEHTTEKVFKEGMNETGKKMAKEKASKMITKTFDKAKEFAGTKPGKILMGLMALGMISNTFDNQQSPLAPELNQQNVSGPTNKPVTAPSSPSQKTVYTHPSGTNFRMSAKSKNKVKHMQMAQRLSAQTEGDTNVNVYDDRSQISNNWLERKFAEIV